MGKKYPAKKYVNVGLIVAGVALFMQSGSGAGKPGGDTSSQVGKRGIVYEMLLINQREYSRGYYHLAGVSACGTAGGYGVCS